VNQSLKAVLGFFFIACLAGGAIGLYMIEWHRATTTQISLLVAALARIFLFGGIIAWSELRRDKAPDYLAAACSSVRYFERDGLCFFITGAEKDGHPALSILWQNRYERACVTTLVLKPTRSFLLKRGAWTPVVLDIEAPGGAFGVTAVPVDPAPDGTDKGLKLDLGARTVYPNGRGTLLRFKEGLRVGDTGSSGRVALTAMAAAGGAVLISSPATVVVDIPMDSEVGAAHDRTPVTEVIWKLGDPPLGSDAHVQ